MRTSAASLVAVPPAAGTTNSSGSCALRSTDGRDTTYATRLPSGEILTSTMVRSRIKSSTVIRRAVPCAASVTTAVTQIHADRKAADGRR